jgi:dihydrofolate synthase/folylpolyglutamate synthase
MCSLDYEQARAFWYGCINYEHRSANPDDLKLDRIRELLRALGDPQERFRIVHVAGSKGKGSTSAMLATILQRAGYRTGLFTSPHLVAVEERIQVDGVAITRDELTALLNDVWHVARNLQPTFFEVATALGFLHFARRRVDVAVVEVGLGGRFDSTNVCRPLVSLITSISFDHTRQLGNRLASIAFEKAGIIKTGRPVISGVTVPEARDVIERICHERRAPLWQLGSNFGYTYQPGQVTNDGDALARVRLLSRRQAWPEMELALLGEHQAANAAVAIGCVEELRRQGLHIPDEAVVQGLAHVHWPARLEVLGRRPLVVLDCAHNVASVEALVQTLETSFPKGRRLLVLACANDKDLPGMLRALAPHFAHLFLTRFQNSARAVPPETLAGILREVSQTPFTVAGTSTEAWQAARQLAQPEDLICVTGSVFLAGELRPVLNQTIVK